jgi:hypothetical protein
MAMSDELFKALLLDLGSTLPAGFERGQQWGPELSPKQVAACTLVNSFYKKFLTSGRTSPEGDAVASEKFAISNERCRTWSYLPNTSLDEEMMGEFKNLLYRFFYPSGYHLVHHLNDLFDRGNAGPGVSNGALGQDFYTKHFAGPLTCTSGLLETAFLHAVAHDDRTRWRDAEEIRKRHFGEITRVEGSRFSFVPKDDVKSRMIAIEPSLNMFYQLGLGRLLEERLITFFGVDITSQPQINREAARFGSVTDSLATLDLSDASDSLGLPMLSWALPKSTLDLLVALRSPRGILGSESLELNMVSTMGNGFTFPLETVIFSAVVVSAIKSCRFLPLRPCSQPDPQFIPPYKMGGYWGVFGDDLICHREVASRVIRLLTLLGFVVNRDKSFVEGVFRESCGRDFFKGHDVRGVYIKSLDSIESRYVAINSLNVWSAKTGIYLPNTVRRLVTSVPWLEVPPAENHDAGIRMPSIMVGALKSDRNGAKIYSRRVGNPKKLTILDGEIRVPKGTRRRIFNPEGLLLAFLHGSVRGGRISLRQTETRYHSKRGVTPYWDYVPQTSDIASLCGWQRWESAAMINLS